MNYTKQYPLFSELYKTDNFKRFCIGLNPKIFIGTLGGIADNLSDENMRVLKTYPDAFNFSIGYDNKTDLGDGYRYSLYFSIPIRDEPMLGGFV